MFVLHFRRAFLFCIFLHFFLAFFFVRKSSSCIFALHFCHACQNLWNCRGKTQSDLNMCETDFGQTGAIHYSFRTEGRLFRQTVSGRTEESTGMRRYRFWVEKQTFRQTYDKRPTPWQFFRHKVECVDRFLTESRMSWHISDTKPKIVEKTMSRSTGPIQVVKRLKVVDGPAERKAPEKIDV